MKGLGTSEGMLLEIICTRTPLEIVTIKQTYKRSVLDIFIDSRPS